MTQTELISTLHDRFPDLERGDYSVNEYGGVDLIDVPLRVTSTDDGVEILGFTAWTAGEMVWSVRLSDATPTDAVTAALQAACLFWEKHKSWVE